MDDTGICEHVDVEIATDDGTITLHVHGVGKLTSAVALLTPRQARAIAADLMANAEALDGQIVDDTPWLTPQEAGRLIKVAPQTLANWRALNVGPRFIKVQSVRGGVGRVRYLREDIQRWLTERSVSP